MIKVKLLIVKRANAHINKHYIFHQFLSAFVFNAVHEPSGFTSKID